MRSIQQRLNVWLATSVLIIGLILTQLGIWLFDLGLRSYFEHDLQEETESLVSSIVRDGQNIYLDKYRINPIYNRPYSGRYFIIETGQEIWRSRSLWDSEVAAASNEGLVSELAIGPNKQQLLVYRADFQKYGNDLRITVARDYNPILASLKNVQRLILAGIVISLLVVTLLQCFIIRRALRPLDLVRIQVEQLQQGLRASLDKDVPTELKPLVEQINQLLVHTGNQLKRSRNSLGNLGHALKTPLAVLVTILARPEFSQKPAIKQSIEGQLLSIEQLLTRELNKARIVGDVLPASYFACDKELPILFEMLYTIHERRVSLDYHSPEGLRLPWNKDDVLELLGNLLDNACKWACSTVTLVIAELPTSYQLTIEDDGPGIKEDCYEDVLSRGVRLDEQVAGHGLGLGIVKDMVDSWQGKLELAASELGGLKVLIDLPKV